MARCRWIGVLRRCGASADRTAGPCARDPLAARELRRPQQYRQLQRVRVPGESAGSGRRRRAKPLRRDDQPGARRLLEDRHAARSVRPISGRSGQASPSPTARIRPATRSFSTISSSIAGFCRSSRRAALPIPRGRSGTVWRSRRPAIRPAPTTATRSRRELPVLPRLPEVRRLDRLVRDHDARVRADGRVRDRGLRAREEQDGQRPAERARGQLLPRRERAGRAGARRRRPAAGRRRRQGQAEDRHGHPDRRHAG